MEKETWFDKYWAWIILGLNFLLFGGILLGLKILEFLSWM